jgi:CheY-like chemotaxis protein
MNAILGYAQLLSLEHDFPSEHKNALQAIDSSGRHLLGLLNDILDISKIESGERVVHPENIYLADLLLSVEHIFKLRCLQKGIEWYSLFDVPDDKVIFADGAKISQILINLLGNSLKFTQKGKIKFLCSMSGDDLRIEVSDSGAGISLEFQKNIFTPFAQDVMGRQKGGTGLGLAIVAKIIHLINGNISFTSQENEGTTFVVVLPLEMENRSYPLATHNAEQALYNFAHMGLKALVLDDVRINCDILSKILDKLGVTAYPAESGVDALVLLESVQPDILFVDIQMPTMNGFEFLEQIKIKYPQLVPRAIAISANVYTNSSEYTDQGFYRYITKPFLLKEISAVIESVIVS